MYQTFEDRIVPCCDVCGLPLRDYYFAHGSVVHQRGPKVCEFHGGGQERMQDWRVTIEKGRTGLLDLTIN